MRAKLIAGASAALGVGVAGWFAFLRDQTTDSDQTGELVRVVETPQGSRSLGVRAVEVLNRHIGEHGSGPKGSAGYHRSPFIDSINLGVYGDGKSLLGKPWCARTVRWAYETAAEELGLPRPFFHIKGTLAMARSWKEKPLSAYKLTTPKIGAVLVLGDSHVALVAKVLSDSTVISSEGNHADATANVKRTLKPGDTLIDVEAYVASTVAPPPSDSLVAGLDLLGAISSLAA